jgi:hypothetical protein
MPAQFLELRRRVSSAFNNADSLIYLRTDWSLVDGKPSTYTPAAHNHDSVYYPKTGGVVNGDVELPITDPLETWSPSRKIRMHYMEDDSALSKDLYTDEYARLMHGTDVVVMRSQTKVRSISNFTTVTLNGTTEISLPLLENPRGSLVGIYINYVYMGSCHTHVAWLHMNNTTIQGTIVTVGGQGTLNTTASHQIHFNVYLKSSDNTIYIKNAYFQTQNSSTSSADTLSAISTNWVNITNVVVL